MHDGTTWLLPPSGITRDIVNNWVNATSIVNLTMNELTLTSQLHPLPLQWGPVKAYRKSNIAYVEWNTYSESNTGSFEIERSLTGTTWQPVGKRIAAFNTPGDYLYAAPDSAVTAAKTFYRIRQTDTDNRFTFSSVVYVAAIPNTSSIIIYPNPAVDEVTVRVLPGNAALLYLNLYSADGKLIWVKKAGSVISYKLSLAGFATGTYILQAICSDGETIQQTIIKK